MDRETSGKAIRDICRMDRASSHIKTKDSSSKGVTTSEGTSEETTGETTVRISKEISEEEVP